MCPEWSCLFYCSFRKCFLVHTTMRRFNCPPATPPVCSVFMLCSVGMYGLPTYVRKTDLLMKNTSSKRKQASDFWKIILKVPRTMKVELKVMALYLVRTQDMQGRLLTTKIYVLPSTVKNIMGSLAFSKNNSTRRHLFWVTTPIRKLWTNQIAPCTNVGHQRNCANQIHFCLLESRPCFFFPIVIEVFDCKLSKP